jgi:RNA polymerase sigma-70 factor (ECF subfamily)
MDGTVMIDLADTSVLSDEQVVARVLQGETALFEILMRRHNQRVYRAARAVVRNDAEAEDILQEAYVRAFAHLDQFAGRAAFSTWLTRIAVHEALARLRRLGRGATLPDGDTDDMTELRSSDDVEERASAHELRPVLEAAIDTLPDSFRAVFMLRTVEEMSTAETAVVLDIPEETVKTRLHRARGLLRKSLERSAGEGLRAAFGFGAARCDRVVAAVLARIQRRPPVS